MMITGNERTQSHEEIRMDSYGEKMRNDFANSSIYGKTQKCIQHYSYYFDRQLIKLDHIRKGQDNTTQHWKGQG